MKLICHTYTENVFNTHPNTSTGILFYFLINLIASQFFLLNIISICLMLSINEIYKTESPYESYIYVIITA